MGNYKPHIIESITVQGAKFYVPSFAIVKVLTDPTAGSNVADSMQDTSTGAVYSLGTSRKLKILSVKILVSANTLLTIYEGATEDATTTSKLVCSPTANFSGLIEYEYLVDLDFAAEKFIVITSTNAVCERVTMIGYEF